MKDVKDLIDWGFKAIVGGAVVLGVNFMGKMSHSIETLNVQMGQMLERSEWQQKALDETKQQNREQDERILKLEQQRSK